MYYYNEDFIYGDNYERYPVEWIYPKLNTILLILAPMEFPVQENQGVFVLTGMYDTFVEHYQDEFGGEVKPEDVTFNIEKVGDIAEVFFLIKGEKYTLNRSWGGELTSKFDSMDLDHLIDYLSQLKIIGGVESLIDRKKLKNNQ